MTEAKTVDLSRHFGNMRSNLNFKGVVMKYILTITLIFLLLTTTAQAHTNSYRIAECNDSGSLIIDLITDGSNTPIGIKYRTYQVIYNQYTDKMDYYKTTANVDIEAILNNEGATSFKVNGIEESRSTYKSNDFPLEAVNFVKNREIYIVRDIPGEKSITIHNGCTYLNQKLFRPKEL